MPVSFSDTPPNHPIAQLPYSQRPPREFHPAGSRQNQIDPNPRGKRQTGVGRKGIFAAKTTTLRSLKQGLLAGIYSPFLG